MPDRRRFHVDQNGHSVSVLCGRPTQAVEMLVDGKVVAARRSRRAAPLVLRGEFPGEPPRPFSVYVEWPEGPDGSALCVLETDGSRYLMPVAPLTRGGAPDDGRNPPARTPVELLWRLLEHHRNRRGRLPH
ncbi:hypothetical protein [Streptomyces bambusae]|uniref:Uncharacterized protein n=1 Tax=Streptomyces bambusae TaxID=1550616 RepID=A0ABS6Z950_9ACTN|nr:hypothetical protein [Streptomyces bambusae]MBW5484283.1 hypothetical protein [Streptomyces bambusae]